MPIVFAVVVGLLAGTHTATWGMYKDAAHEGFTVRKYMRSIALSSIIAPLLALALPHLLSGIGELLVLFGTTYVIERGLTEFYKTFIREEDQSKYFIPMQFAVRGKIVQDRRTRLLAGAAVAACAIVLVIGTVLLDARLNQPLSLALVALAGSAGGWFSACGGAWKDAPHEGFDTLKFFRSPLIAAAFAVLLYRFTDSITLVALAGLGYTVATLETYKTFFFPDKPRGKFAGKAIRFPEMLTRRNWFVPLYAGIWLLLLVGFALGR